MYRHVSSVYLYPFILIDIAILTLLTLSVAMISIKVIKDSNQIQLFSLNILLELFYRVLMFMSTYTF